MVNCSLQFSNKFKDTYEIKTVIIIMCLNLPFEVKNQLTFYEVRWFKYNSCYSVYSMFFRIFEALQMFFYNFLLKWWKNEENFKSSIFSEAQKYFVFEMRPKFFFQMVIFATLFRRCPTLWKSTLKMTTLFRHCLTLLSSKLKNSKLFRHCSTL